MSASFEASLPQTHHCPFSENVPPTVDLERVLDAVEAGVPSGITFIPLHRLPFSMSLEETVDYLAEELDLERSEHVREVGQSVAVLRD